MEKIEYDLNKVKKLDLKIQKDLKNLIDIIEKIEKKELKEKYIIQFNKIVKSYTDEID